MSVIKGSYFRKWRDEWASWISQRMCADGFQTRLQKRQLKTGRTPCGFQPLSGRWSRALRGCARASADASTTDSSGFGACAFELNDRVGVSSLLVPNICMQNAFDRTRNDDDEWFTYLKSVNCFNWPSGV